jgi:hypothetical protein
MSSGAFQSATVARRGRASSRTRLLQVRNLLGYSNEQMGHAQWLGHILNRLQLTDRHRRKAYAGGQMYSIKRAEVLDMMRRYEIDLVAPEN